MVDESKSIKNKLLRAKDIYNVFDNLRKKGYGIWSEKTDKEYFIKRIEKNNVCVRIYFRNTPERKDYKQEILLIQY